MSERNTKKPEHISIHLPTAMILELDQLKEKEGIYRTAVIIRALKYWASVEGNINYAEYFNRMQKMEQELAEIRTTMQNITANYESEAVSQREIISEPQKTINTLLRMLPKED